ncbi:MAG: AMP-binding protein, partial [Gammaproteobacteria bacterium]|nr:AMP-binding protein [Gammaproteobacteria bacterium]
MRPIDYYDRGAAAHPERIALSGNGIEYTYAEAVQRSTGFARGLYAAGFTLGEAVAVFAPNDPRAMLAVIGTLRA